MTSVLGYINTGSVGGGGVTLPQSVWCRPAHKPTGCVAIWGSGGNCCVCVPTTATCFIIEMWGQGGGGAGGCCCGDSTYGGQGGSYGWVACTTSATNHILCACTCTCLCSTCNICSGPGGQFSKVCNQTTGGIYCVAGGGGGLWQCGSVCCCNNTGKSCNNTWCFYVTQNSLALACTVAAGSGTPLTSACLNFCNATTAQTAVTPAYSQTASTAGVSAAAAATGPLVATPFCVTSCTCFNYYVQGLCGWSDTACGTGSSITPYNCLNNQNGVPNAHCGGGTGVGGAAYAGGDQQWWNRNNFNCNQCYGRPGNFPGGGGVGSGGATAWTQPGATSYNLILISWC